MTPPLSLSNRVVSIEAGGQLYALIVRGGTLPDETAFVTCDEHPLQLGHIVYPAGHEIARHAHRPVVRTVTATAEVLLVQHGRCEMDVFDADDAPVTTVTLETGDVALLLAGGHGFRMLADTVLLEVKQGPYGGPGEKRHF